MALLWIGEFQEQSRVDINHVFALKKFAEARGLWEKRSLELTLGNAVLHPVLLSRQQQRGPQQSQ